MPLKSSKLKGFTLAEVLIALALLGIIAAFSLPKVLHHLQNTQRITLTKEAIATVSEAYQRYLQDHPEGASPTMTMLDLEPYINSLGYDTSSVIDNRFNGNTPQRQCTTPPGNNGQEPACLKMPNGLIIAYLGTICFGNAPPEALPFQIDADGKADGVPNVRAFLYKTGKVATQAQSGQRYVENCFTSPIPEVEDTANNDPPWFQW